MFAHLDSETVQKPWMCWCTYCKDVYVGLICLRVIYLPKDHNVTLEISGEIFELCSILFVTWHWQSLRLRTNTGRFLFLLVQYYCSNHSQAEPLSQQGHNLPQDKLQAIHSLKSYTHTTCRCVSHLVKTICIRATVDLCCLFTTVNCWAFYRTYCTYFSNWSILQNLWNITGDWFFSQQCVHGKSETP